LTTKDQYKYSFNCAGYLQWMEDKNGNRVTIAVEGAGKVRSITDAVGRTFTVNYDGSGRISSISAPGGLTAQMTYNTAGLMSTLKDPEGNCYSFEYDGNNFLTKYKDRECQIGGSFGGEYTEQLTYDHTSGVDRVTSYIDSFNNTQSISYDTTNNVTAITDSNQRIVKKYYDTKGYVIKTVDPLNLTTTVSYNLINGNNLYGEEAVITDRNGNTTTYTRDARGNITRIDYPDGSASSFEYDSKNNLTKEIDQEGKKHFYIYDANGNLIEDAIPINGTSDYTSGASQDQFVAKKYSYSNFGNAKGLLQSSTDGNGNTTKFDYDAYGYMKSQTDVNKHVTAYTYSITGNLIKQVDPDGMITTFAHDKNGNLLRKSIAGKYTTRYFYDKEERPVREISPNEYRADLDGILFSAPINTYNNPSVGKFTTYYKSGSVKKIKDNVGFVTSFQYDSYGNKTIETKPNDAQYVYAYDGINRITRTDFKKNSTASAIQLDGYEYIPGANCNTKYTKYLSTSDTAITTTYYDKLDREITITSPEGHTKTITYYKNGEVQSESDYNGHSTYYKYDGLNRKTFTYDPVEEGQYSCTQTVYDKNDNVLEDRVSRNLVVLDAIPAESEFLKKVINMYDNEDNVIKTLIPGGGETAFEYNITNDCIKTSVLKNSLQEREEKTFAYNDLGLVIKETTIVRAKDIYGNDEKASGNYDIVKMNTYDLNGNLIKIVRPNKYQVNNTYDANNRLISSREDAMDENGALVNKTTKATYDYDGNVLTATDALGNTTTSEYDQRGNLIKKYTHVTSDGRAVPIAMLYAYDNAGRLVREVSPKNFVSGADIDSMNRTEYGYDKEDRLLQTKSIYKKPGSDAFTTVVTKAMTYDNNGNVLTEKDAMGVQNNYATVYTYNYDDQLVKILKPTNAEKERPFSQKLVYDGLGRVVSEIDGRGVIKNTYYNDASKVTKEGLKLNDGADEKIVAKYEYDFAGNQISKTDGNGNKTTYDYTHTNQLSSETTPSDETIVQMTTNYQYDPQGKLKKKKTSSGLVQVMNYDPQGNLLSTYETDNGNQDGILTQTRYDLNGNARYMIDGNNNVTSLYYDESNRLVKKSITTKSARNVSTVHTEQSVYDASGNVVKVIDWLGNTAVNDYDALGRLIKKAGADGVVLEELEYNDNNAQVKSVTRMDNQPLTMIFEYDKNNRLIKKINNGIAVEAVTYDGSGSIETKADGNNNTYSFYYDEANKLIRVVNPLSAQTVYTYDPAGNIIGQKNENGDETLFEYNCLNLPKKKIDAGGRSGILGFYTYDLKKVEAYTYYPNCLIKEKVDRNGIHTTYQYDVHGRLLVTKAGSMSVVNTYDKNGNKLSMTDATGATGRVYDAMNRCIVKTVPNIGATIFDYDIMTPLGACKEVMTDPKGNVSSKVFDKLGRIIAVENAGVVKANYSYYENGLKKSVSYPQNDVTESYTYYPNG
jgi:YD repeat-containing protein